MGLDRLAVEEDGLQNLCKLSLKKHGLSVLQAWVCSGDSAGSVRDLSLGGSQGGLGVARGCVG